MQGHGPTLGSKAFGQHADPKLIVAYESHQEALRFLNDALALPNGIALLQGPTGSGKTTIAREQADWIGRDAAVAMLDGVHLSPRQLITGMLSQFGVEMLPNYEEQTLPVVNKFLTWQTRDKRAPVLIVDNVDRTSESTRRMLNWLAALEVQDRHALRIILTGSDRLAMLIRDDSLRNVARRHPAIFSLNPLTRQEAAIYLRTRLIAAGTDDADALLPLDACGELHELSQGWPGGLNVRAHETVDREPGSDTERPTPRAIVTRDGIVVREYTLEPHTYLIGRSSLADIVVEDRFVSKLQAMLKVYRHSVVLLDLHSTNGTTVNSVRRTKAILRSGDIITLGHHRLKIEDAPDVSKDVDEQIATRDTQVMKQLVDVRRQRAKETLVATKGDAP